MHLAAALGVLRLLLYKKECLGQYAGGRGGTKKERKEDWGGADSRSLARVRITGHGARAPESTPGGARSAELKISSHSRFSYAPFEGMLEASKAAVLCFSGKWTTSRAVLGCLPFRLAS